MQPSTIGGINRLPEPEKRAIYARYIPRQLLERFNLPDADSQRIQQFLNFKFVPGSTDVEMSLFHEKRFPDPILYAHLTDTMNGQIHILLYILNDPDSPRFDVDKLPDGTPTKFGTLQRNVEAEKKALEAGLAPGQIRRGLRMLGQALEAFEGFIKSLGHDMYFAEPLYYHNAVIFERYGFSYQMGKRLMESIHAGFQPGGELCALLDGSNPFRRPDAGNRIRKRSWAIHDSVLGEPFTNVTMYKRVGVAAGINTTPGCDW
jgi:acetoin utilization protein AcuC